MYCLVTGKRRNLLLTKGNTKFYFSSPPVPPTINFLLTETYFKNCDYPVYFPGYGAYQLVKSTHQLY